MKKLAIICFLLLLQTLPTFAQRRFSDADRQMGSMRINRSLYFNYDLYTFANTRPDSGRLDLVLSVVNDLLQFVKMSDSLYQAKFDLSITILDQDKNLIYNHTFLKKVTASNYQDTNARSILHSYYHSLILPVGRYKLNLELTDLDIRKSLHRSREFEIPAYLKEPLALSDVVLVEDQFSSRALQLIPLNDKEQIPWQSPFHQRTMVLSPFPVEDVKHYRVQKPTSIYFEVYRNPAQTDSLYLKYRLLNAENDVRWESEEVIPPTKDVQIKKHVSFNPEEFDSGLYVFQILAREGKIKRNRNVRLYLAKRGMPAHTDTTAVDEFGPLRYIADKKIYEKWLKLSPAQRDSAIAAFWKERDPTPGTPENELREEFIHRVRFANQNFISLVRNRPGWQTDQGKVYIVYGPPSQIFHPSISEGLYRHEIWIYDRYGRNAREMKFIFVFRPKEGEYELLKGEP